MNRIVEILMKRDGMTKKEAEKLVKDTSEEISECTSYDEAEDIMANNLGLEMDYLFDLMI